MDVIPYNDAGILSAVAPPPTSAPIIPGSIDQPSASAYDARARGVLWAATGAAIVLRVTQYLLRRELGLDESMLALNVVQRDMGGLLHQLSLSQGAPIGFLVLLKLSTMLMGETEYVFRLPSLLAGIMTILLLPALCRLSFPRERWLPALAVVLAAFNTNLVYYAVIAKPYAIDALGAVAVPLLAMRAAQARWRGPSAVAAACLFALLPWLSFAAIFTLMGVGAIGLAVSCRQREWSDTLRAAIVYAVSAASFLVQYWMFVADNPFFKRVMRAPEFSQDVVDFTITSSRALQQWGAHGRLLFGVLPAVPPAMAGLAALVMVIGASTASSRMRLIGGWLFGPVVAVVVAAAAHQYPLAYRTLLFLIPGCIVLLALGVITLSRVRLSGRLSLGWVAGVLLLAPAMFWGTVRVVRPFTHQGLIDVVAEIAAMPNEPRHAVLIDASATPVFNFYDRTRHFDQQCFARVLLTKGDLNKSWEIQQTRLDAWPAGERVWLVIGMYRDRERALEFMRRRGRVVKQIERFDFAGYLFEPF